MVNKTALFSYIHILQLSQYSACFKQHILLSGLYRVRFNKNASMTQVILQIFLKRRYFMKHQSLPTGLSPQTNTSQYASSLVSHSNIREENRKKAGYPLLVRRALYINAVFIACLLGSTYII